MHIVIRGAVQGVGFRPFIYRLASGLRLHGWVCNSAQGVFIEAEGPARTLETFLLRIERERPPRSFVQSLEYSLLDPRGYSSFQIRESDAGGEPGTIILPDIATCPDCVNEIFTPANRRYRYPFTNCTNCGPRFTIIEGLPYDRPKTSMRHFVMCDHCRTEYEDPENRRFHAQPNACPVCGPQLELRDAQGTMLSKRDDALREAAEALRTGKIVAVKGIGGFHLMVDARNNDAIVRLREKKHREEKPFALMAPSLEAIGALCDVSHLEERLLGSPEAPIVLLRRRYKVSASGRNAKGQLVAYAVAPGNPHLGFMLPYTPLHHLLMRELGFPVVATSGNLTDEPICIDEQEAAQRLGGIADLFLVHNRPIVRHVDDSIVRVVAGRQLVIRRARGYAPLPVHMPFSMPDMLAVGAHLKSAVAVCKGDNVFISQYLGDLETSRSFEAFRTTAKDLQALYEVHPAVVACDQHPDYLSTHYARNSGHKVECVQHHYAHVAACMAENELDGQVLGVSWDGTGYGPDGTVWGGEFLLTNDNGYRRVATLRQFRLPGGQAAIKEPRRTAIGLLYEMYGEKLFERHDLIPLKAFTPPKLALLRQIVDRSVNSPATSSAGRLFDAVAAITGIRQIVSFEGQAAMELESAIGSARTTSSYQFQCTETRPAEPQSSTQARIIIDWAPLIQGILSDMRHRVAVGLIAAKFHNTLAGIIVEIARRIGEQRVLLTGGCFQNRYLTERTVKALEAAEFKPYWHQRIPPNDGGIALGQAYALARAARTRQVSSAGQRVVSQH